MIRVEAVVILFRFLQYGSASVLLGSALVLLLLPGPARTAGHTVRWHAPLLLWASISLVISSIGGLWGQTAVLAGSFAEAARPETVGLVISTMALGKAAVVRAAAALVALLCLAAPPVPRRTGWTAAAMAGAIAAISFAWSGHGVATEGAGHLLHLLADIVHSLAAAIWLGALAAFALMVPAAAHDRAGATMLHHSLTRFSAVGTWLVGILVLTGLANTWFLAGADPAFAFGSPYGRLLAFKIVAFGGMLALAAAHRWLLVPALDGALGDLTGPGPTQVSKLRLSMAIELSLGLVILGAVSWLGTLAPPAL